MNYFAHGLPLLDDPYMLAGVSVPDWLSVVDRKVRARKKFAAPLTDHDDPKVAALAKGIVRHHDDDDWFHATAAFNELQWDFTVRVRDCLGEDRGLRPSFLGHILVELLLDASLIAEQPDRLDAYYDSLAKTDSTVIQQQIESMTGRRVPRLAEFVELFLRVRFLYDYLDDGKLLGRLNQVMSRVRLAEIPSAFAALLPGMREAVDQRRDELLHRDSAVRDR